MAFYWNGGPSTPHAVSDVSSEGVFVSTDDHWSPDSIIRLTLQRDSEDPEESGESISVQCRVVRAGADGVGMAIILAKDQNSGSLGSQTTRGQWNKFVQRLLEDAEEMPIEAIPNPPLQEIAPITVQENPGDPTAHHDPKEDN